VGALDGKVAIITGAGGGIGKATAIVFAKEGAALALVDVNGETVASAAREVSALGARAIGVACDVQERAQVIAAVQKTVEAFGGVDILVQYAQAIPPVSPLDAVSEEDLVAAWRSGVIGGVFFMQACFPHMRDRGGGKIVNVGSGAGVRGSVNRAAYDIAKEGVRGMTKVAANEWGKHNITVNVICPAADTAALDKWRRRSPEEYEASLKSIPMGRIGDPELDIGRAVLALVGSDLRYLTGASIMLDGGSILIS